MSQHAKVGAVASGEGVRLPHGALPVEVAPGVFGVRVPLPFALDHVNLWLLRDGAGWTVIDAGIADEPTREVWHRLRAGFLGGRPVLRLIATHFHPDHLGLAGWLVAETGAELWASHTEWLTGRLLALDLSPGFVEAGRVFDHRAGLAAAQVEARAQRGNLYRTRVVPPPPAFRRVRAGDRLTIDGRGWQVLIGRGHAPEMLCLYSDALNVLIAADQVLPRISPNVGVWPAEPFADPLRDFLRSLEAFRALPDDCLVLPSHGQPFIGPRRRVDELILHHQARLEATLAACAWPLTAVEVIPALFERTLDAHQLSFALCETLAHLNYLVEDGRILRRLDDDGRFRYQRR